VTFSDPIEREAKRTEGSWGNIDLLARKFSGESPGRSGTIQTLPRLGSRDRPPRSGVILIQDDNFIGMSSACQEADETRRLGEYLRLEREAAGLSQRELAKRLGCQQPAISRLEAGGVSPNVATLQRIAEALGRQLELQLVSVSEALTTGQPFRFQ